MSRLFLILMITVVLFSITGVFVSLAETAGWISHATEKAIAGALLAVLSIASAFAVRAYAVNRRVRFLFYTFLFCLVVNQFLNLTEEWPALSTTPILGGQSPLNGVFQKVSGIIGSGVLFASIFEAIRAMEHTNEELRQAEAELRRQRDDMKEEISAHARAAEALSENEARYRAIVEEAPLLICRFSPGGGITYVNQTYCNYFGKSPEELTGTSFLDLVPPQHRETVMAGIAALTLDKPRDTHEHPVLAPDGSVRWQRWTNLALFDAQGHPKAYHAIGEDVTERREAREALRKSNERNNALMQALPDLFFVLSADGVFVDCHAAEERQFLVPPEVFLQKPAGDVLPPELAAQTLQNLNRALSTRKMQIYEYCLTIDGLLHHYESRMVPMGEAEVLVIIRDITERKQYEEALRSSEERYRGIFDESVAAIYVFDNDKHFMDSNQAGLALLGYSREELLAMSIPDVDADPTVVLPAHSQLLSGGNLVNYEHSLRRKDGTVIVVLNNSRPLTGEDGQVVGMQSTLIDITERKRLEEEKLILERQVQHVQKLESLGVLAGGIAHDFNNILAAVLGYAELAMAELAPTHPALANIREIVAGANRAAELTRQMLAYSGKGNFVVETLDMSGLLDDMAHLLRTSIPRTITLNLDLDRALPPIKADVAQVQQIVMNLITNAAEAIGDGPGVIALSTGVTTCAGEDLAENLATPLGGESAPAPGDYVYFEVRDTGCGMDGETRGRLFEPFFTTKFSGRGLGMAAVLGIVRGHKGLISLETTPGKGSVFRVLFPPTQDKPEAKPETGQYIPDSECVQCRGIVLVVEDDKAVRNLTGAMLERKGLTVLTAADGRQGAELFREHADKIVCVLLDLTMPHLSGQACFEKLCQIREDVKVIAMSGYSEQQAAGLFHGRAPAAFLHKPFRQQTLNRMIEDVLRG